MSNQNPEDDHPVLSEEDQARVDHFIRTGVNATEKKPFRPILLLVLLIAVGTGFSLLSQMKLYYHLMMLLTQRVLVLIAVLLISPQLVVLVN